ncbi:unnamed protein product [Sphagnum balticum]
MSKEATATVTPIATPTKAKRTRTPSKPRKIFAVVQVLNEAGEPVKVTNGTVKLVEFCKSAEQVLNHIDGGTVQHGMYLSGYLATK